jgi:hypothetical protein
MLPERERGRPPGPAEEGREEEDIGGDCDALTPAGDTSTGWACGRGDDCVKDEEEDEEEKKEEEGAKGEPPEAVLVCVGDKGLPLLAFASVVAPANACLAGPSPPAFPPPPSLPASNMTGHGKRSSKYTLPAEGPALNPTYTRFSVGGEEEDADVVAAAPSFGGGTASNDAGRGGRCDTRFLSSWLKACCRLRSCSCCMAPAMTIPPGPVPPPPPPPPPVVWRGVLGVELAPDAEEDDVDECDCRRASSDKRFDDVEEAAPTLC